MTAHPVVTVSASGVLDKGDLLAAGLARLMAVLPDPLRAELEVGFRRADDAVVVLLEATPAAGLHVAQVVADALRLPRAEVSELRPDVLGQVEVYARRQRLRDMCDLLVRVDEPHEAVGRLRLQAVALAERRNQVRVPASLSVRFTLLGGGLGVTRDLSSDGVCVETDGPLPSVGARIKLEYDVGEDRPVEAVGVVVRREPGLKRFSAKVELPELERARLEQAARSQTDQGFNAEKRGELRRPERLRVELLTHEDVVREYTLNISHGGVFVRMDRPPAVGSVVSVLMELPQGEKLPIAATVVHVVTPELSRSTGQAVGCGLQFRDLGETVQATFQRYLASKAPHVERRKTQPFEAFSPQAIEARARGGEWPSLPKADGVRRESQSMPVFKMPEPEQRPERPSRAMPVVKLPEPGANRGTPERPSRAMPVVKLPEPGANRGTPERPSRAMPVVKLPELERPSRGMPVFKMPEERLSAEATLPGPSFSLSAEVRGGLEAESTQPEGGGKLKALVVAPLDPFWRAIARRLRVAGLEVDHAAGYDALESILAVHLVIVEQASLDLHGPELLDTLARLQGFAQIPIAWVADDHAELPIERLVDIAKFSRGVGVSAICDGIMALLPS